MWILSTFGVSCLVGLCISADIIENAYRKWDLPVFPASETSSQPARSKVECAAQCSRDDRCSQFRFDRSAKACYTYNKMVATAGEVYREKAAAPCPFDHGYQIYDNSGKTYCFKNYPKNVNHAAATAICKGDGAHLVLFEDQNMYNFVNSLLTLNAWGNVWIDAFDVDGDNNYRTSRGDILPFLPSDRIIDSISEKCIRLAGTFRDTQCTNEFFVLCQRDV